jgi:hypothetical protein
MGYRTRPSGRQWREPKNGGLVGTCILDTPVTVFGIDGSRLESFNKSEGVKDVHRFSPRAIFEPVSPNRVASTYAMDWSEFCSFSVQIKQSATQFPVSLFSGFYPTQYRSR